MPKRSYDSTIIHTGENDVSINFINEKYVYSDLKSVFKDGEKLTIEIKTGRKPRSLKQNSVLHWYINEISQETGIDTYDVKELLRHKFLSEDIIDQNGEIMADMESGEVLRRYKSTAELSTIEFNEFTEKIRLWSNEFLGLQLPLPNEEVELRFE